MARQRLGVLVGSLLSPLTRSRSNGVGVLKNLAIMSSVSNIQQPVSSQAFKSFLRSGCQQRSFSDELHSGLLSELSEAEYHKLSDHTLESMLDKIEAFVEELDIDGDVEYSQGVMTVKLGSLGTYVINKQTPNRQIWMSSPVSGPVRYDYIQGQWVYSRDGHVMVRRIEEELKQLTGRQIDFQE